jgi:hypothetical protein
VGEGAKPSLSEVSGMDRGMARKDSCLAQAAVCRAKAEADAENRDFWINEAIKWLELAINPAGHVAVNVVPSVPSKIPGDHA